MNPTPLFHAELTDKDGINASGGGIGHDLELVIDGEMAQTYVLNDYFEYDFGEYRSGSLNFSIPALSRLVYCRRWRAGRGRDRHPSATDDRQRW